MAEKEELNKEIDTKEKEVVASIDGDNPFYLKVRDKLNGQGCGMCLAKWTQVTLHLQLGYTLIHVTIQELTQYQLKNDVKKSIGNFITQDIKNFVEKKC